MTLNGLSVALTSLFLVFLGGYLAYKDSFLTVQQMHTKGFERGLPFLYHGGMICDVIIMTPVLAYIGQKYSREWSLLPFVTICVAAWVVSCLMHQMYIKTTLPEAHTYGHVLVDSGQVHRIYMAGCIALITAFYFITPHGQIDPKAALIISALLVIHVFIGTHGVLKIINPPWFGVPFKAIDLVPPVAVAVALTWRTYSIIANR